jgi:hypothetical protein
VPNLTPKQQRWNNFGIANTAFAMFGQAIFASLLLFKFFANKGMKRALNYALMPLTAFTAFKGKYEIVRYFNTDAFINIPNKTWREILLPDLFPDLKTNSRTINATIILTIAAFTINISGLFAFLSNIAYRDASELISDDAADVMQNEWFNFALLFMGAGQSFFANVLAFPFIQMGGLAAIKDILTYPFRSPSIRRVYTEEDRKIDAVLGDLIKRFNKIHKLKQNLGANVAIPAETDELTAQVNTLETELKDLTLLGARFEKRSLAEINSDLKTVDPFATEDNDTTLTANTFRKNILTVYDRSPGKYTDTMPQRATWGEFIVTKGLAGLGIAAATAGLFNFQQMWGVTASDYGWHGDQVNGATEGLGWPALISMALMSAASVPLSTQEFTDWLYGRNQQFEFQSTGERYLTNLKIFFICAVGASANGYQAFKAGTTIANSEGFAMFLAFIGPLLVEYGGYKASQRKSAFENATQVDAPDTELERVVVANPDPERTPLLSPGDTTGTTRPVDGFHGGENSTDDGDNTDAAAPAPVPTKQKQNPTPSQNHHISIGVNTSRFFAAAKEAHESPLIGSRAAADIIGQHSAASLA